MINTYLCVQLLSDTAKMPVRANPEDAGLDVFTPKDVIVKAQSDLLIPLDIRVEFPKGFALITQEKSGISTKKKLDIGAKIIDSNYRGNCHVHLFNNSDIDAEFKCGEKIAQLLLVPIWCGNPIKVENIDTNTSRGEGGFGSTGNI